MAQLALFRHGPSTLSRLIVLAALALFLMVADARFHMVEPVRSTIATALYPAQWLALRPVLAAKAMGGYLTDLKTARQTEAAARTRLIEQSQRAAQVEQLLLENSRLRALLELRSRLETPALAAQILYDATDPYNRRVVLDKGSRQGIRPGAPVIDESGLLGQVSRVYPFASDVTLLVDREQLTPVMNARTGATALLYGNSSAHGNTLEMRYLWNTEDLQADDLLVTSGIGGIYPPGLPVARVHEILPRSDSAFSSAQCTPTALLDSMRHVMVLQPLPVPALQALRQDPTPDDPLPANAGPDDPTAPDATEPAPAPQAQDAAAAPAPAPGSSNNPAAAGKQRSRP